MKRKANSKTTRSNAAVSPNRSRQLGFIDVNYAIQRDFKTAYQHGGSLLKGKRKSKRPISTKDSMHFVLRSTRARGVYSFLSPRNYKRIESIIRKQSHEFGVKIYNLAINGNHIHLLVKLHSRLTWKRWLRAISGLIARAVLGVEKGYKKRLLADVNSQTTDSEPFWDSRPWSRIVNWGKAYRSAKVYVEQNFLEAWGFIPYQPRKRKAPV